MIIILCNSKIIVIVNNSNDYLIFSLMITVSLAARICFFFGRGRAGVVSTATSLLGGTSDSAGLRNAVCSTNHPSCVVEHDQQLMVWWFTAWYPVPSRPGENIDEPQCWWYNCWFTNQYNQSDGFQHVHFWPWLLTFVITLWFSIVFFFPMAGWRCQFPTQVVI